MNLIFKTIGIVNRNSKSVFSNLRNAELKAVLIALNNGKSIELPKKTDSTSTAFALIVFLVFLVAFFLDLPLFNSSCS